jgi:hypothetical protein
LDALWVSKPSAATALVIIAIKNTMSGNSVEFFRKKMKKRLKERINGNPEL